MRQDYLARRASSLWPLWITRKYEPQVGKAFARVMQTREIAKNAPAHSVCHVKQ